MPKQSASSTTKAKATSKSASSKGATTKAAKKPRATKTVAAVETETVTAPVEVVQTTSVSTSDESVEDTSLQCHFTEFLAKLTQVSSQFSSLKTEFRTLEKRWTRELKAAQKATAKKKKRAGNRQPSGFVKPTLISTELANFLNRPHGSEMARTEVTREINKYIRSHDLQDKDNGRKINPDPALRTLLKLKKSDELTYFNLQRYMSPHFAKAGAAPAAETASV